MSESLQPHRSQHTSFPCPSLCLGVCSNSRPLSWWCRPTVSSSVATFSSCLQSFQAFASFPMSWCIRWPKYWNFNTIGYLLLSLKKEGNSDTCYKMDEPWGHYAKRNKPVTNRQILSHQVTKVLELQLHHQSLQWKFKIDLLRSWSPSCPRHSQESPPAP